MSGVNPSLLSQIQSSLSSVLASAKAKAAEFIRSNNQGSLREEDIVTLYKIILSPAELIQHEMYIYYQLREKRRGQEVLLQEDSASDSPRQMLPPASRRSISEVHANLQSDITINVIKL